MPSKFTFRRSPQGRIGDLSVSSSTTIARSSRSSTRAGFSLIEILAVLAVVTVITGLSVPALNGINSGTTLNTSTAKVAGLMSVARSEAISRHTIVRFVVVRDWANKLNASLRRVSLWVWDSEIEKYVPLTPWEDLSDGVVMEPAMPDYIKESQYAHDDLASVSGDYVLSQEFDVQAEFNPGSEDEPVDARYIEFTPSGNLRVPGGRGRNAIFVLTNGFASEDGELRYSKRTEIGPANWAQINVDRLTGRVRVYQP